MKKRIVIIATAVFVVATLVVGSTMAFFTDKGEVNNVVTIGKVNITLTEPNFAVNTKSTYQVDNITPGMYIEKDPTVTNVGDHDAYIRCKLWVTGDLNDDQQKDLINAIDFNPDFTQANGYYYYQKVLDKKPASGESKVKFFNSVTIPNTWDNTIGGKKFTIHITAEAIQKDNFRPTIVNSKITAWQYSDNSDVPVESALSSVNP
ncbi:MAG TPA: TasA family protein [Oscillospiraceae bacterium]|nr:TasA family protein [Oscillospiraceae bacterium]